jgi:hypothetical protein
MSLVPEVPRLDMEVDQPEQTTKTQAALVFENPGQDKDAPSIEDPYRRTESLTSYESDEADRVLNTVVAPVMSSESLTPHLLPQISQRSSPGPAPCLDSSSGDDDRFPTSSVPEASVSRKEEVFKQQPSPTENDKTIEKDTDDGILQSSHIPIAKPNTVRNDLEAELGRVKESLKTTTIKEASTEQGVSFASIHRLEDRKTSY